MHERQTKNAASVRCGNTELILSLIEQADTITRTELTEITGISPAGITRIVNGLIRMGLVYEREAFSTGQRGRKAVGLSVRSEGMHTAGVFLEPDRMHMCVINAANCVVFEASVPLNKSGVFSPEEIAAVVKCRIEANMKGERISSVGVCLPGAVDALTGRVLSSFQMGWKNEDVGYAFSEVFGVPAWVENDVKACLIEERLKEGAQCAQNLAYIMIGNGVGVGLWVNGGLVRGRSNQAGEVEYLYFPDGDGLTRHVTEKHIVERAKEFEPSVSSLGDVVNAYNAGKNWAAEIVKDFLYHLKFVSDMVEALMQPDRIVFGGCMLPLIQPQLMKMIKGENITFGSEYVSACTIGAARLCKQHMIREMIKQ